MKKRIPFDNAKMTPFERFFAVDFDRLLRERGGPQYGSNGLAEIGWGQLAAEALWDAMGQPDFRHLPLPAEPHGGCWLGVREGTETAKGAPEADDPFACLESDPVDLFDGLPMTGQTCSECGLYQRRSKSGEVCKNGHGGVPGEEPQTHYWYHPESNSLFTTAPGAEFPKDGLVEHIDKETFEGIAAKQAAEKVEDNFDIL